MIPRRRTSAAQGRKRNRVKIRTNERTRSKRASGPTCEVWIAELAIRQLVWLLRCSSSSNTEVRMVRGRSAGGGKAQGGDLCEGRKMMATITEESKRSNTATRTSCSRERGGLSLAEAYKKETQMMNRESIHRIHSFLPLESALPA